LLYVVSTPIGNLEDFSQRAIQTLQICNAVLCEDTRRTAILLNRYDLKKPLIPYHKFNEAKELENILARLEADENLALVSDAGTPCINDPGIRLTQACVKRGIRFTAIPGPCSLIMALVLSGFETETFQFIGYLPKKAAPLLRQSLFYPGATIAFESPERLVETLQTLNTLDSRRSLAVSREMTKTFEECRRGTAPELLTHFLAHPPKGEIVLVIGPGEPPETPLDLEECIAILQTFHGLTLKEAIKHAARLLKLPKSAVYKKVHIDK
jgi:16S rRNA (cytidine1402-2'-O)-methyltransferase